MKYLELDNGNECLIVPLDNIARIFINNKDRQIKISLRHAVDCDSVIIVDFASGADFTKAVNHVNKTLEAAS